MERHFYNSLNTIHQDVYGRSIDTETYGKYIKSLRLDSSAASLSRIRENMVKIRDDAFSQITSCFPRETIVLTDSTIKTKPVDPRSTKNKNIMILSLCNNISSTIQFLKAIHSDLSDNFRKCCFYFLTNNNNDETKFLLNNWMQTSENVGGTFMTDNTFIKRDRYIFVAQLRNILWRDAKQFFGTQFDYILILDGNINQPISADKIISSLSLDEPWDIVCANRTFLKSSYHQDIRSLKLNDDPDTLSEKYDYYDQLGDTSLHWIDKLYIFNTFYKVKSAFGGIMLINGKAFKLNSLWDEGEHKNKTEHVSLCEKFLNVYVNPRMTFQHKIFVEGTLYPKPYMFIPRDCGFFSAFNYMLGMLIQGYRIYPYFNLKKLVEKNKMNNHFYYVTEDIDNSWFNYFEPLQFYDDDITHTNGDFLLYNNTQGELSSDEFKYPHATKMLYKSPDFQEWRYKVNTYFNMYIKPSAQITARISEINVDFTNIATPFIGVLVRHPAHAIETGQIYFEDYFKVIDDLLEKTPDANIYLVTDTDLAVLAFESKYKNKVFYDPQSGRASIDNILRWAFARGDGSIDALGMINKVGYEHHMEQARLKKTNPISLGVDIISNTYVLAKCKWFVYIPSNISLAVSYINPSIHMIPVKEF